MPDVLYSSHSAIMTEQKNAGRERMVGNEKQQKSNKHGSR